MRTIEIAVYRPGNTISVIELLRSLCYVVGEKKENKYIITWGL